LNLLSLSLWSIYNRSKYENMNRRKLSRKEESEKDISIEDTTSPRSSRTRHQKSDLDVEDDAIFSTPKVKKYKESDASVPLSPKSMSKRTSSKKHYSQDVESQKRQNEEAANENDMEEEGEEEGEEGEAQDDEMMEDDIEINELVEKIGIPHFTLPTRNEGRTWFCLGMDLAKYVGMSKSFPLFTQYPNLKKYTANEEEKEKLYEMGFLPIQLRRKTKTVMARLRNIIETVGKDYDLFNKERMNRMDAEEEDSEMEEHKPSQESMYSVATKHKYASYLSNFQRSRDPFSHRSSLQTTAKDAKWIYHSAKSATDFNVFLNEERKKRQFQFYDINTNVYQISQTVKPVLEILYDQPVDEYPIAFYPGQIQHYIPAHKDRFPTKVNPDPPSYKTSLSFFEMQSQSLSSSTRDSFPMQALSSQIPNQPPTNTQVKSKILSLG
jgi:hypothetical protein